MFDILNITMKNNNNNVILDEPISIDDYKPEISIPHHGSLEERFAMMSEELEQKRKEELHRREQERLRPFREKIAQLESLKKDLQNIHDTILPPKGKSKQEILDDALFRKQQQEDLLEILITDNYEVLALSGIRSIQDIINHSDFATTPEVVTYHAIHAELDHIYHEQKNLIENLKKYNIILADKDFTYSAVLDAVGTTLNTVHRELITEKQNTPEGRQEVSRNIQKLFISELPVIKAEIYFSSLPNEKRVSFEIHAYNGESRDIVIRNDMSIAFDDPTHISLIPVSYTEIEKNFSREIAEQALSDSFQELLKQSLMENYDLDHELRSEIIEKVLIILNQTVKLQRSHEKLKEVSPDGNIDFYIHHKNESNRINQEVKDVYDQLEHIQNEVEPNEVVFLVKTAFRFPGKTELYKQIVVQTELVEKSLAEIVKTLVRIEQNEPFFGKQIWENNIATLKAKKVSLEKEIRDLQEKQQQTYAGSEEYLQFKNHYSELKTFLDQDMFAQPQEGTISDLKKIVHERIEQFLEQYESELVIMQAIEPWYQVYNTEKNNLHQLLVK